MNDYNLTNFNNAPEQVTTELMPGGTFAKVSLLIRPGGIGPEGMLTESPNTGSIYLDCEFTVVEGPFIRRKFWDLIGIKGSEIDENGQNKWGQMGKALLRAVVESARNIHPDSQDPQAVKGRELKNPKELNGLIFVAKIGVKKSEEYGDKNKLVEVLTPKHKRYAEVMHQQNINFQGSGNMGAQSYAAQAPLGAPTQPPGQQVSQSNPAPQAGGDFIDDPLPDWMAR